MVRHALQDVKPLQRTRLISTADTKIYFLMLVRFLVNKLRDLLFTESAHQNASCAMFRFRAGVDADAASSTNAVHQWQYFLELRRHRIG